MNHAYSTHGCLQVHLVVAMCGLEEKKEKKKNMEKDKRRKVAFLQEVKPLKCST